MVLEINDKIIPLKIGLKGSMLMDEIPNLNVKDNADIILHLAISPDDLNITPKQLRDLVPATTLQDLAKELYNNYYVPQEDIRQLYSQAIGEIGIHPDGFWNMTKQEFDLAYQGYMRRKELEANLNLTALEKALNKDFSNIELEEDEQDYTVGSITERERIMKIING